MRDAKPPSFLFCADQESTDSGMAKAAAATLACGELIHDAKLRVRDRQENQLCDSIPRRNGIGHRTTVPARDHQRPLVVGVDQTDEIAEHESVLVTQSR